MLKEELKIFLTAVLFYTRIPCPSWVDHSEEYLGKSRKYFPVIGWIVGAFCGLIFYGAQLVFPAGISVLFSMAAGILLTGAFHEDGFADVCDGFGGGWTKEKILAIMKDSRVGAFGAIGIVLLLSLKFLLLLEVAAFGIQTMVFTLIAGHSLSRFTASTFIYTHAYVQDSDASKSKPVAAKKLGGGEMILASVFGLLPLFLFQYPFVFFLIIPVYLAKMYLGYFFKKWIGGYTGDCLGATQQVCEVVFYLGFFVLWNYF